MVPQSQQASKSSRKSAGGRKVIVYGLGTTLLSLLVVAGIVLWRPVFEELYLQELKSPDLEERKVAATRLAEWKSRRAVPILIELLPDELLLLDASDASEHYAAGALVRIGKDSIPCLLDSLSDDDLRYSIVAVLSAIGAEAVTALIDSLEDQDARRREHAGYALGEIVAENKTARSAALPAFRKALEDEVDSVRAMAAYGLRAMGVEADSATAGLLRLLEDRNAEVRGAAALALGTKSRAVVEANGVVEGLIRMVDDENLSVRERALVAFVNIGPGAKAAIPKLLQALRDSHASVRGWAADALGAIGVGSMEVLDGLRALRQDLDEDVRLSAERALRKLGEP